MMENQQRLVASSSTPGALPDIGNVDFAPKLFLTSESSFCEGFVNSPTVSN